MWNDNLLRAVYEPAYLAELEGKSDELFRTLICGTERRYQAVAERAVSIRNAKGIEVPFAAFLAPDQPNSGPYGGMSVVIFPVKDAPALLAFVVGTQGLAPDEEILGRPGHSRRIAAISTWLNRECGKGKRIAWAKQDPTRIDLDCPLKSDPVFGPYKSVFDRYGRVLYGVFAPTEDRAVTARALTAYFDLMFEERGGVRLSTVKDDPRDLWFRHMMPETTDRQLVELLNRRRYVVLEGPPGTGKTRMAEHILEKVYGSNGTSVQFHANTTYENVIGGLAPVESEGNLGLAFRPQMGVIMKAAAAALQHPDKRYLLHIDEINRADLSKVLGEAIFLFEADSKKPRRVELAYDFGEPFGNHLSLPENLHVLGTMNTADRSIAIVDVAVRRRFAFTRLWPQMEVVQEHGCEFMQNAFKDLTGVFVEHATENAFNLIPGHSYFLEKDESLSRQRLKVTLAPLLEEYLAQGYVAPFAQDVRAYLQWIESLDYSQR